MLHYRQLGYHHPYTLLLSADETRCQSPLLLPHSRHPHLLSPLLSQPLFSASMPDDPPPNQPPPPLLSTSPSTPHPPQPPPTTVRWNPTSKPPPPQMLRYSLLLRHTKEEVLDVCLEAIEPNRAALTSHLQNWVMDDLTIGLRKHSWFNEFDISDELLKKFSLEQWVKLAKESQATVFIAGGANGQRV